MFDMSFAGVFPKSSLLFVMLCHMTFVAVSFCLTQSHSESVQQSSLDCFSILQDISNVSPWSQITAQFNLFNSGSSNSSTPSASTAGRRLLHKPDHLAQAAAMQAADGSFHSSAGQAAAMHAADGSFQSSAGRSLLQTVNSSYPDFEAADTTTSDLTKEGKAAKADQIVCQDIMQLVECSDCLCKRSCIPS